MPAPRATETASRLILTVYGAYARADGWLATANAVRLLGDLGVDPQTARSALSRLKARGLLASERRAGAAGHALTPTALEILAEGDRRIFERDVRAPAGGWVLAVFSLPEAERHQRHRLRARLASLGFGTVAAGTWVAPAHVLAEARHAVGRLGLEAYVELFEADHLGFTDSGAAVARWWDLDELRLAYGEFVAAQAPVARRWRRNVHSDGEAFADYIRALNTWRRVAYLDPGLPAALLPAGWPGARAAALFAELQERLSEPGRRHVAAASGGGARAARRG